MRPAISAMLRSSIGFKKYVSAARTPPIAATPVAAPSRPKLAKLAITGSRTDNAAEIRMMPAADFKSVPPLGRSLVNIASSPKAAPMVAKPKTICSMFIEPKSMTTSCKISKAAEIRISDTATRPSPADLTTFENIAISARRAPTEAKPLPISSQLRLDMSIAALARILIAAAIKIIWNAPPDMLPPMAIALETATMAAAKPATPRIPTSICSISSSAMLFKARAKIAMPVAKPRSVAIPVNCSKLVFNFVNIASEPNNSVNRTVIAPRESVKRSGSIAAKTVMDPARMAMATAILRSVPALMLLCHASRDPRTESKISVTFSEIPSVISVIVSISPPVESSTPPVSLSNHPRTDVTKAASIPELKTSIIEPRSAVPKISPMPEVML